MRNEREPEGSKRGRGHAVFMAWYKGDMGHYRMPCMGAPGKRAERVLIHTGCCADGLPPAGQSGPRPARAQQG